LHGKVYRGVLRNKVGGALAVAWFRNAGLETALQSIFYAFSAFGMIFPTLGAGSACPWGATGLSSEGGMGKFDPKIKLGVLNDEFGLRSARSVGIRVAKVARIVKAGQESLAAKGE
jgi:multimeric flavodoxin WrbA